MSRISGSTRPASAAYTPEVGAEGLWMSGPKRLRGGRHASRHGRGGIQKFAELEVEVQSIFRG